MPTHEVFHIYKQINEQIKKEKKTVWMKFLIYSAQTVSQVAMHEQSNVPNILTIGQNKILNVKPF